MKINYYFSKAILIFSLCSGNLISQSLPRCPCRNVELELIPDSSIIFDYASKLEINTSYISWNDFIALGDEEYPENDEISDVPHNFHSNCFGCLNTKVYARKSKELFTGEINFLRDDIERNFKNIPIQRIQIKEGLKNGYEVHYNVDDNQKCYYPQLIAFLKNGEPYKKLYEFEYVEGKLKFKNEESYKNGLLYGLTKTYDNYGKNGHQLIYEANIINFPSRECCNMDHSKGNGLHFSYPLNQDEFQFEGIRIEYFANSGKISWVEQWNNGKIQFRNSYYDDINKTCKLKHEYPYEAIKYIYTTDGEIIEESIKFFSDCNSSIELVRSTKNYLPYGKYEKYSEPGQLLEKGNYNNLGQKEGIWELYNERGIIMERTNYESDQINGIQEIFNEKGILFRKLRFKENKIIEILK